jgi:hypothetical protein
MPMSLPRFAAVAVVCAFESGCYLPHTSVTVRDPGEVQASPYAAHPFLAMYGEQRAEKDWRFSNVEREPSGALRYIGPNRRNNPEYLVSPLGQLEGAGFPDPRSAELLVRVPIVRSRRSTYIAHLSTPWSNVARVETRWVADPHGTLMIFAAAVMLGVGSAISFADQDRVAGTAFGGASGGALSAGLFHVLWPSFDVLGRAPGYAGGGSRR